MLVGKVGEMSCSEGLLRGRLGIFFGRGKRGRDSERGKVDTQIFLSVANRNGGWWMIPRGDDGDLERFLLSGARK